MLLQLGILLFQALCVSAISTQLRAIGIGVTNRTEATKWYNKVFGTFQVAEMKLATTPGFLYDESILSFRAPDKRGATLVLMELHEKEPRSVKDLPIKLQFAVPDVQKTLNTIVANAGRAMEMKSEQNPTAIYAKDPDGYLLELIPSTTKGSYLAGVTIGTKDIQKKAVWWTKTTEMRSSGVQKFQEGDVFTLTGDWGAKLEFIQLKETTKRNTDNLPYKIVLSVDDGDKYMAGLKANGGKQTVSMALVGPDLGFAEDPTDRSSIEINSGALRGPP